MTRLSWPVAFALGALLVAASIAWVDKPVAAFVGAHLYRTAPFDLAILLFRTFDPLGLIGLAFLLAAGAWGLSGRPLGRGVRTAMLCCSAGVIAFAAAVLLKYLTGRSGADVYAESHVSEWHPFSRDRGHFAFPSATMLVATAACGVLWVRQRSLRATGAGIVVLLVAALLVANGHWVSDIIAGTFLGWFIGRRLACAVPPSSAS